MHKPKIVKIGRKNYELYDYLKADSVIAGACPDCMHVVEFNTSIDMFRCTNSKCCFLANKDGFKVYSNELRKKGIKEPIEIPSSASSNNTTENNL